MKAGRSTELFRSSSKFADTSGQTYQSQALVWLCSMIASMDTQLMATLSASPCSVRQNLLVPSFICGKSVLFKAPHFTVIPSDPTADMGEQVFTYALLPHVDSFQAGGVIEEAFKLNV